MFVKKTKKTTYKKDDFEFSCITYRPLELGRFKKIKAYLKKRINPDYLYKLKRFLNEDDVDTAGHILGKAYKLYFQYVIAKCIEGYAVPLFNTEDYVFKVYGYTQDENELNHKKVVNKMITDKYGLDYSIKTTNFWLKNYRIGLFRLDKETNLYHYQGYFLRLNKKYKQLLADHLKQGYNYDNIQFR